MKLYTFLLFAILSVTTYAQKEYKLNEEFVYHVSVDQISEEMSFNEVFEDYIYVPLKKTPEYTIGKITQLLATDNRLFVVADGVYCYDFEGNPIYHITEKGHARNEFVLCESVSISDSMLYMYDRGKRQTHVYNLKDGKFQYNIPSPSVESLYRIGKGFVIDDLYHVQAKITKTNLKGRNRFFVYNEDFSTIRYRAFGKEQHLHYIGFPSSLGNDCFLYSDYYECKLYKIMPDKILSYVQIDCDSKYKNTSKDIQKAINSTEVRLDDLHGLEHIGETKSHIFGQFTFKGETYQFFFDKKSKHSKIGSFFSKIGNQQIWHTNHDELFSSSNYLIRYFTPEQLTANQFFISEKPLSPSHPDYKKQEIIMNCKPEDNPIIVLYIFKHF